MGRRGPTPYRPPIKTIHLELDRQLVEEFDALFKNRTEAIESAMRLLIDMAKARAGLPVSPPTRD